MDYNYDPSPRDPRYLPTVRQQNLYASGSNSTGYMSTTSTSPGFYSQTSSGPGQIEATAASPGFYNSVSSGSTNIVNTVDTPGYYQPSSSGSAHMTPSLTSPFYPSTSNGPSHISNTAATAGSYPPSSNGSGQITSPATSPGFYTPSSSGSAYISNSSLGQGFYSGPSSGSAYMATSGPSYPSMPPALPSYNSSPSYSNVASSCYNLPFSGRRDSANLIPEVCELIVEQQPQEALLTTKDKEKMRKPIDAPPILQLTIKHATAQQELNLLQNPYLFASVTLIKPDKDEVVDKSGKALMGTLVSSCQRLKNVNNEDGAWFVFADISVMVLGTYRLGFTLHEFDPAEKATRVLAAAYSAKFDVVAAKDYRGLQESTMLTRTFAEQGCRLRLRKEPRGGSMASKRRSSGSQGPTPNAPILPAGANAPIMPTGDYSPAKRMKHDLGAPLSVSSHPASYQPPHPGAPQTPNRVLWTGAGDLDGFGTMLGNSGLMMGRGMGDAPFNEW
ncbi:predicted protein [Plenodomus lingam JN3]|uniref:Predicted protein n=1 Tax=Leptosphaeria maculans (strain JN3 / isolate v23.1.3 / race Av1-4-5-6-7-8) TaxID=985895 RepID=E4ZSP2_LEPMJ|nr:predicted protein [Plenodomus lingam JN3]CBX94422.1 predicted protein [Plenodomus lingam JN3]